VQQLNKLKKNLVGTRISGLVGHCIIVDDFGNDLTGPEYKVGVLGGEKLHTMDFSKN